MTNSNNLSASSSSSAAASSSSVSGYLKQKGLFSRYSSYFFVLAESTLLKYKNESSSTADEEIELDSKHVTVMQAEGISGKKHSIALFVKGKAMILRARSAPEFNMWYGALQSSVADDARLASPPSKLSSTAPKKTTTNSSTSTTTPTSPSPTTTTFSIVETLEAVLDASIISDEQGVIVGFNKAAESLFGYTREEIFGQNVSKLMPKAFAKNHSDYMRNYNKTGKKKLIGIPRKFFAIAKDGTEMAVMLHLGEVPQHAKELSNNRNSSGSSYASSSISASSTTTYYSISNGIPAFVAVVRPTSSPTTTAASSCSTNPTFHLAQEKVTKTLIKSLNVVRDEFNNSVNAVMLEYTQQEERTKTLNEENQALLKRSLAIQREKEEMLRDVYFLDYQDALELQRLFAVPMAYEFFLEFCKKEKCEETLMFLKDSHKAVTRRKAVAEAEEVEKTARHVYNTYLSPRAPLQINTSAEYLASFVHKISKKQYSNDMFTELFHDAQLTLNPALLKFANSPEGKAVTRSLQLFA